MKNLILLLLNSIMLIFLTYYVFNEKTKVKDKTKIISSLIRDNIKLRQDLDSTEYIIKSYDTIIRKHKLRIIAYNHSKIKIPRTVCYADLKIMDEMSEKFKIPKKYIYRLIHKESRFKPNAKSYKNAQGYMQILPNTFNAVKRKYEVVYGSIKSHTKSEQNIIVGIYFLKRLYNKYNNWDLAFAAYNAGSGNVKKYNGIPKFKETINYVQFITNI